ncbi:ATP-binding protein [Tenacibaculum haliotis]|uniref:ATP-binding protein n=1 Tax=Tenacibaculum haliotis TaxID=1888914 RepID=UPI0021B072A3|nr:ATP-binding protein [Tenacibaculum haliotis]MCT4697623.1 ATP-binding protein [Tenacibaculum haliotis]
MKQHTTKITSISVEQSGLPTDYRKAIAEYIWNGFDANATEIHLNIDSNEIGFINEFSIIDNGNGINIETIDQTFGHFLDSQKRTTFNKDGFVKGKKGKGRFSFQQFSDKAIWNTTFKSENGEYLNYNIEIKESSLQNFGISDKTILKKKHTGTSVRFESFNKLTADLIENDSFYDFLACEFGWFLYLNKSYSLKVNDFEIDYNTIIDKTVIFNEEINDFDFKINFIRWKKNIGDKYYYYFLNEEKIEKERKHTSFNNKTEDFHHSVYIESDYFETFQLSNAKTETLDFDIKDQNDPTFKTLLGYLKEKLSIEEKLFIKEHKADELISKYRKQNIFPLFKNNPYDNLRKKDLELVVKEIYCVQPKIFQGLKNTQSKTIIGFLNLLLDSDQRDDILNILDSIIKLSDEERKELSKTLNKTNFSAIVSLVKLLESRFNTVLVLKTLVFELEKFTNERDHIQKIIEDNYWLFGEQYHLVSADKNFETLLNNYLSFLESNNSNYNKITSKNRLKRPDIFIARKSDIPDPKSDEYTIEENIIVELKRPSVVIGKKQYDQIEEYIRIIIKEPRFSSETRKWKLILIGKEVDEWIRDKYESQNGKGKKFLVEAIKNYEIYALKWDDLFRVFDIKHKHLINKLEFKNSIIDEFTEKGLIDVNMDIFKEALEESKKVERLTKIARA